MRVAMLVRCLGMMRGGGETRHLAWAHELRVLGVDVQLIAGSPSLIPPRCPIDRAQGVHVRSPYLRDIVYRLQGRRGFGRLSSWMLHLDDEWFVAAAWRHLAGCASAPDIVHAHALHQTAARRRLDVPVVINLPGIPHDRYKQSLGAADALVSDGWGAAHLPDRLGLPVEDVPKGVDTTMFKPEGDSVRARLGLGADPVVLTVARLVPIKNIALLLDAFALLRSRVPSARLVVAGDGPLRAKLERQAEVLGCADRVQFAGQIAHDDLPAWYRAADVLALTSHFENSPNVVLEAMASGVPVVAVNVGGVSRYVAHGRNGSLVPADDAPAIAEALAGLLTDRARAQATGRQNRSDAIAGFSWRTSAERLLALYKRLLEARAGAAQGRT